MQNRLTAQINLNGSRSAFPPCDGGEYIGAHGVSNTYFANSSCASNSPTIRKKNDDRSATVHLKADVIHAQAMTSLNSSVQTTINTTTEDVTVWLGFCEECCFSELLGVMAVFQRHNPHFKLKMLSVGYDLLLKALHPRSRCIDLALVPRGKGSYEASPFWKDQLIWIAKPGLKISSKCPIPLVLPDSQIPTRYEATKALAQADRQFRISFESSSHLGLVSALQAGLGVAVGFKRLNLSKGLTALSAESGLPKLPEVEFVLAGVQPSASSQKQAFAAYLHAAARLSFEDLATPLPKSR